MNSAASGTSRRAFLGRAAGAAAVVAGAGVGAGALAQSAAAADQRTYTAGHFALELDGVACGKFVGLDGGDVHGNVVSDGLGTDYYTKKHIGGVKYEDFALQVGSGMGKGMYNWIKDSFDKGVVRKNGAIIAADFDYREKNRASMSNAFITEVTIPALDGASKETGYIKVKINAENVVKTAGSGGAVLGQKAKAWLVSNFDIEIDGVNTKRVASVDSFTWKCSLAQDGSTGFALDVSDLALTFPRADVSSWRRWYQSMINGGNEERHGALTLIGANDGAVVTFQLGNLGLYRITPAPPANGIKRVKAELYVEEMRLLPTVNK